MAAKLVILVAAIATLAVLTQARPDHCESYLMQSTSRYGSGRVYQGSQYFDECCRELRMMDPRSQCQAMERIMEQMGFSEEMGSSMMDKAMRLPMMCGTMSHKCTTSYMGME